MKHQIGQESMESKNKTEVEYCAKSFNKTNEYLTSSSLWMYPLSANKGSNASGFDISCGFGFE